MKFDLSSLQKGLLSLGKAVNIAEMKMKDHNVSQDEKDIIQAGVIRNFEFTFELCWKFIQRWIRENRSREDADHPVTKKDLFRQAAALGLVADPKLWFIYSEKRNLTSHTYDQAAARDVFETAVRFLPDAEYLYRKLEESND